MSLIGFLNEFLRLGEATTTEIGWSKVQLVNRERSYIVRDPITITYKKLGGVGDLSRSTRLELFALPLLLLLLLLFPLLLLLRSERFSRLLLLSRS